MPHNFSSTEQIFNLQERGDSIENSSESNLFNVFFHKDDLVRLLDQENAIGIRFYPGSNQGQDSLIGVGVEIDETITGFSNKRVDIEDLFILSGGPAINAESDDTLSRVAALNNCIAQQNKLTIDDESVPDSEKRSGFFSVFFSREAIQHLLDFQSCAGLRIYCHVLEHEDERFQTAVKPLTLFAVPVGNFGQALIQSETAALESLAPCPPDCGDPNKYLNPYNINLNNPASIRA